MKRVRLIFDLGGPSSREAATCGDARPRGSSALPFASRRWDSGDHLAALLAPSIAPVADRRRRAFTLVEVLIGLAILGLAAIVLGAAYANTLEAHRAAAARAAVGAPVDFLREQLLNEPERDKVEKGGDVQLPDNRRLRWEAKIEETPVPDLFQLVVTGRIDGEANRAPEEFSQRLTLLRPTWSDGPRREQLRSEWRASRPKEGEK